MRRRGFLGLIGLAPAAAVLAKDTAFAAKMPEPVKVRDRMTSVPDERVAIPSEPGPWPCSSATFVGGLLGISYVDERTIQRYKP